MSIERYADNLGVPDIKLAGLQIWIHNRQFSDHDDFWDSNWLNVTVHCGACAANVWTNDAILHLSEIADWLVSLEKLNETLSGEANLVTVEPEFNVELKAESLGQIEMRVEITPDPLRQQHVFTFEVDQSYLAGVIGNCRKTLTKFSLVGEPA